MNHSISNQHQKLESPVENNSRIEVSEWVLLLGVLAISTCLRFAFLENVAIEHFDEGVYASNLWFGEEEGFAFPDQHLYAPPLFPALLEWSQILFGISHLGVLLVNLLVGVFTSMALWWVGRNWFSKEVGLVAALLVSLSDFHVLYSRSALTDPLLCLLLLLAVFWWWQAVRSRTWVSILFAGVLAGLAWSTKYTGWLSLAIAGSGASAWVLFPGKDSGRPEVKRVIQRYSLLVGIAILVFCPVWLGLQDVGGYAAVAANHRQYFVGLPGWWNSFLVQLENHRQFDGPMTSLSLGLAFLVTSFSGGLKPNVSRETTGGQSPATLLIISLAVSLGFIAAARIVGTTVLVGLFGAAGIGISLWTAVFSKTNTQQPTGRVLAYWLTAAWFCGLLLATPCYYPYPRLTLPWFIPAWLGTGLFLNQVACKVRHILSAEPNPASNGSRRFAVCVTVLSLALFGWVSVSGQVKSDHTIRGWQDRTGLETIAKTILADARQMARLQGAKSDDELVIYIYAEPGLFYHLKVSGQELVGPVSNLEFLKPHPGKIPFPTFLVGGPHAIRSPAFQQQFSAVQNQLNLVGSYDYYPSDLVVLNHARAQSLADTKGRPREEVRLYLAN